jgi:CHAD domain-containing protein/HD superfamily phosphodiesterase
LPATAIARSNTAPRKAGLGFWMDRVLEECDRAAVSFAPDPVHDLRVGLRRCRSMADGLMALDPDPAWKQMKKAGKQLFGRLGELRDAQVMQEWVHRLDSPGDPVTSKLLEFLVFREAQWKQEAARALEDFDRKQWRRWSKLLPRRAARLRPGTVVFKHLALERWTEAHELHRQALRNRSQAAFHRLRIGLKRFRYITENFLPEHHLGWGSDLKELQDVLGEIHDLDVLWTTAQQVDVFPEAEARARWRGRIQQERMRRVEKYREKMLGPNAPWQIWRAALPSGEQIGAAALRRLKVWASFLDPGVKHSNHVARLALELFDGLAANGGGARLPDRQREILRLAALLHDVGRSRSEKGRQKVTHGLIRRLHPPLGVSAADLQLAGVVARYHRGALPRAGQKALRSVARSEREMLLRLAAILRLADAFDAERNGAIGSLEVGWRKDFIVVQAQGYSPLDPVAERVSAARHLLEVVYRRPVMVKPLRPAPMQAPKAKNARARKLVATPSLPRASDLG